MARILLLAAEQFRDEELLEPLQLLREAGHEVETAGPVNGPVTGLLGAVVEVERRLEEVEVDGYDMLVMPGGDGTPQLRENQRLLEIVEGFAAAGKWIGALCWAPTILAKLGLLHGREVAVCYIPDAGEYAGKQSQEVVEEAGGILAETGVVRSGKIITGSGPRKAKEFGQYLVKALAGESVEA